jgi:hypothetical protein
MKFLIPALALVATVSMPAFAQEAPDATSARPSTQQMEAMQKLHEQMRQLHDQARLQMLGSLSAAHRTAIANIIGQLAIAPNPNRRAAAAQIDALLSNGEKQSVLTAEANERTNSRSMMESARAQFEASATPEERAKMQARDQERATRMAQRQNRPQRTPDAGMTLLRIAGGGPAGPGGPGGPGEMGARRGAAEFDRGGPPPGAPN